MGALLSLPVNAGTFPPPQLVNALCTDVDPHPVSVPFFTVTPQTDGTVVAAFIVQGVGKWSLVEVCPGCATRVIATGIDSVNGDVLNVVVIPADGYYQSCYLDCVNMHGYPAPGQ